MLFFGELLENRWFSEMDKLWENGRISCDNLQMALYTDNIVK